MLKDSKLFTGCLFFIAAASLLYLFDTLYQPEKKASNQFENIKITCSSRFTDERVENINIWMQTILKSTGIESSIEQNIKNRFKKNTEECISKDYPAERYILTFKKAYFDMVGKHSITMQYENCGWLGPQSLYQDEDEILEEMSVTQNYLIMGEGNGLRINKSTFTGTKFSTYNEVRTGPYPYKCAYKEF